MKITQQHQSWPVVAPVITTTKSVIIFPGTDDHGRLDSAITIEWNR